MFIDTVLPFGLRSAPKVFTAVADGLEWVVHQDGVREIYHYLDDFLVLSAPGSDEGKRSLEKLLSGTQRLVSQLQRRRFRALPWITFLGIEVDSDALVLRLPQAKLWALKEQLVSQRGRRSCTKSELHSLAGYLQHACKVVRPGITFLSTVFELL